MGESVAETSDVSVNRGQHAGALGWVAALSSAAFFGTSGSFAAPLLAAGWTPAAAVAARLGGAALILAVPAWWALRGQWHHLRASWRSILLYGLFAGAMVQVAYFYALQYITVGLALLIEYLGVVWVVFWVWLRRRHPPSRLAAAGMVVALAGLVVILNPGDVGTIDLRGVAWALLASIGMAVYFITSAETPDIPPVAFVSSGLGVGAVALTLVGVAGLVPFAAATQPVELLGRTWAWWVPVIELIVVAAALAYLTGFVAARRLGATIASFVGLTEVVFAVVWAWLILGQVPGSWQLVGGAVLLAGVAAVQRGSADTLG